MKYLSMFFLVILFSCFHNMTPKENVSSMEPQAGTYRDVAAWYSKSAVDKKYVTHKEDIDYIPTKKGVTFTGPQEEVSCADFNELYKEYSKNSKSEQCIRFVKYFSDFCEYIDRNAAVPSSIKLHLSYAYDLDQTKYAYITSPGDHYGDFEFNFTTCQVSKYKFK